MTRRRVVLAVVALLVVVLVALPFLRDREDRDVIAERDSHRQAGHSFVATDAGVLHYALTGPPEGELVVLIHGVSGPMTVWDHTEPALVAAGYRVLRFDHFGRGLSDRIEGPYDLALYVDSVTALLAALAPDARPHLVGSSMGAIVAAAWAQAQPERVRSVALIGPAGFELEATPAAKLMKVPYLSGYLMKVIGDGSLAEHNEKYFYDPSPHADFQQAFEEQLRFEGSKHAILSTLQHTPVQAYLDGYRGLAGTQLPVLALWGEDDRAFPFEHHAELEAAMPDVEVKAIAKAGHLPMYERPETVTPLLLSHLAASR